MKSEMLGISSMSDGETDSDLSSTFDKNSEADDDTTDDDASETIRSHDSLSQTPTSKLLQMQLHSKNGKNKEAHNGNTDFSHLLSNPPFGQTSSSSSSLSTQTSKKNHSKQHKKSSQNPHTQVLTQVLAGGKRVHMFIKNDPEVAQAQDEEFYQMALDATVGHHVSQRFRNDVEETIAEMKSAKEVWKNKRLEGEGETHSFLRQKIQLDDNCIQVAQCSSIRRRGVWFSSKTQHMDFMSCLARDMEQVNNIALAFSEMIELIPNKCGVALHVQLKYRSSVCLPTNENIDQHVMIAQNLMKECYPNEVHALVILASDNYMKLSKSAPSTNEPLLCKTVHLIWPAIVVYDLRTFIIFWKTLDCRISNECPFFSNIVELQTLPVVPERIHLRVLGNYKVTRCMYCRPIVTETLSNHEDFADSCSDISDNEDENFIPSPSQPHPSMSHSNSNSQHTPSGLMQSLSQNSLSSTNSRSSNISRSGGLNTCIHCSKGRIVVPYGVLKLYAILDGEYLNKSIASTMTFEDQIKYSSIARPSFDDDDDIAANREAEFLIPKDAPGPDDRSHAVAGCPKEILFENKKQQDIFGVSCNFVLYASELRAMKALYKSKTCEKLTPSMRPDLFALCNKVIQSVHEIYAHVVATQITLVYSKSVIYVNVKGKNQRYCILNNGEHSDCRCYFTIIPKSSMVRVQCYDPTCKAIYKLEMDHIAFNSQTAKRKQHGAAGGHGKNVQRPREMLTEEQTLALDMMKAHITVDSGWRGPLFAALGQTYMGKQKRTPKIQHLGPVQATIKKNTDNHVNEDDELVMDKTLMIKIPRSLLHESWQTKIEYLNEHNITTDENKPLDLLCAAQNIPKVTRIPAQIRSKSRPTLEERKRVLEELQAKSKFCGDSRTITFSASQP